jgi:hypothetical protein
LNDLVIIEVGIYTKKSKINPPKISSYEIHNFLTLSKKCIDIYGRPDNEWFSSALVCCPYLGVPGFFERKHNTSESESGMLERKRFSKIDFIFILVHEGGEKREPFY